MAKTKIVETTTALANLPVHREERVEFLDSGSTLLNLAASQKGIGGGWARGHIVNIVGDGSSGKTLLTLEACAHAFYHLRERESRLFPPIKELFIVYNNVEGVMDFPLEEMYGNEFCSSVVWVQTPIAEEFGKDYLKRVEALESGQCLIYVVDSLDALVPQAAATRMGDILSDKTPAGSYGAEKAKFFSAEFFSHLCGRSQGKDATLFCISQVRQNIGVMFGEKHIRTGGQALNFYTHQVCWLAQTGRLEKTFRGHKRPYGIKVKATFKRSKVAKPFRTAEFAILFDYGLDDINSMIDYLFSTKSDAKIQWGDTEMKRADFVAFLEDNPVEFKALQMAVEKDWAEVEAAIRPNRKSRFVKEPE